MKIVTDDGKEFKIESGESPSDVLNKAIAHENNFKNRDHEMAEIYKLINKYNQKYNEKLTVGFNAKHTPPTPNTSGLLSELMKFINEMV